MKRAGRERRDPAQIAILTIAAGLACWIVALLMTGGFVLQFGEWRLSSRNPKRLFIVYAALLGLYAWRYGAARLSTDFAPIVGLVRRLGTWGIVALAIAVAGVGILFGSHVAGGADAYGYVSQADLWTKGTLQVAMPVAAQLPWPDAEWSLAPLGYRPATIPHHIVPTYAPGLPLMMAAASLLHPAAVYWIVPALGGLLVWFSYRLGCIFGDRPVGVLTAALMASSPVFVHHLVVPMSDVPAAAFWTGAMAFAMSDQRRSWVVAGLLAACATLVRPNTVVLALVPLAWLGWRGITVAGARGRSLQDGLAFLAGLAPGAAIVGMVNARLYGSPLLSGYGALSELYSWRYAWGNLRHFAQWFLESETPFILLALVAPVILWRDPANRARVSIAVGMIAAVIASYIFYLPFENWGFLRFLLPAVPFLLAFCATTTVAALRRMPPHLRVLTATVLIGAACVWRLDLARGAFGFRESEQRYVTAARYVAERLPPNAAFLSVQHSGTIRHYAGRLTVRWDAIEASWLDRAPDILRNAGFDPYILLEESEERDFRARFAGRTRLGALDWGPVADLPLAQRLRIYDPDDAKR